MKKLGNISFLDIQKVFFATANNNRLFHHFSDGRSAEIVSQWKSGRITARECLLSEAELFANYCVIRRNRIIPIASSEGSFAGAAPPDGYDNIAARYRFAAVGWTDLLLHAATMPDKIELLSVRII